MPKSRISRDGSHFLNAPRTSSAFFFMNILPVIQFSRKFPNSGFFFSGTTPRTFMTCQNFLTGPHHFPRLFSAGNASPAYDSFFFNNSLFPGKKGFPRQFAESRPVRYSRNPRQSQTGKREFNSFRKLLLGGNRKSTRLTPAALRNAVGPEPYGFLLAGGILAEERAPTRKRIISPR